MHKALHEALYEALRIEVLHEALRIEALHEALRIEALHEALRTEALHEALRTEALHEALRRVPAIFPIASTRASALYSHLIFFTLPSLHPPYLGRHQNGSQQRTVARTRRPLPEPDDDRCQNQTTTV